VPELANSLDVVRQMSIVSAGFSFVRQRFMSDRARRQRPDAAKKSMDGPTWRAKFHPGEKSFPKIAEVAVTAE